MTREIIDDRLMRAIHLRSMSLRGLRVDPLVDHVAYQAGTLRALMDGNLVGDATIDDLLRHGDTGIGTVENLGGELIILDGRAYVAIGKSDIHEAERNIRTPFAVVTMFEPTSQRELSGPLNLEVLVEEIEVIRSADSGFVTFRVDGDFSELRLRSVKPHDPPFHDLVDAVLHQVEWSLFHVKGTLVGFGFPDALAGIEVPGFHVHFISNDRTQGGHVLSLQLTSGVLSIDGGSNLHLELPRGVTIDGSSLDRDIIREVEGGRK